VDAAALGERLLACHGETAVAYWAGRALFELGAWRDARDAFTEVRDRLPSFARARLYLAACHAHLGDDPAAAAEHAAALDAEPDATIAALRISPVLERLAAASPDDRGIRSRLGAVLLAEGDPAGAARVLAPLLAEQPSDDAVRLRLARALVEQGKIAEARAIAAPLGGRG
jgi:thioredoxin-like negative regulator of GroEL